MDDSKLRTRLTVTEVATYPLPGMAMPVAVRFSPDNNWLTYLHDSGGGLMRDLYALNLETEETRLLVTPPEGGTTEETVSREEALWRERQRQRALGITQYAWSGENGRLLIPLQGNIYVQDGLEGELRQLVVSGDKPALDARFSPDGEWVAYVQDGELMVVPAAGGTPQQLTYGARESGRTNGLAEYIAQEEMDRSHGYWWSPDSEKLAFVEVDETHIPVYRILHQGKDAVGEAAQEDHRYPFAGEANARVRLGVMSRDGGEPVWMDLGANDDIYLARVKWLSDGRLTAQILNREQTQLDLLVFDAETGQSERLLRETNDVWINLHHLFRPLKQIPGRDQGGFIWASERTRFRHLYLYDETGELIRPLTGGDWMVDGIAGIDTKQGLVYFTATAESPLEQHLYVVALSGGEPRRLPLEPGQHNIVIDRVRGRFVDVHQALDRPPTLTLRKLADGKIMQTLFFPEDPRLETLDLIRPELISLENRHRDILYGAIYRPPARFGNGPFPTIVSVYGGPHAQRVTNSWGTTVDMRAQYLASLGFLVFKLDNRGSARRGLEFESAIKHDMGRLEVEDQVDGVRWLVTQGLADPVRVGIYGWSYGGYMALMCLLRAPEIFKAAVAGAPVTHWDGYDTCYTERYMGTPQGNPQRYETSSVVHHVDKLEGHLLLVHGLIDENVHFRHTARLINALIKARKPYELLLFPDERHMPRSLADRIYMEERIRDFFEKYL